MNIDLNGIIIIAGNYGSGKTEVSINLAVAQKGRGVDVRLADLDLVNPYFRTREARDALAAFGIDIVLPPKQYMQADLPILSPAVAGLIRQPNELTLLDAGGDDVGATVLAALADVLRDKPVRMLQVVNPFRPFTDTVNGCSRIRREIEAASKLEVGGIIGNANLIDETTPDHIREGYDFVRKLSDETGLPLEFVTVPEHLLQHVDTARFTCPVLPIQRQLVPPWKRAARLGPGSLNL